MKITVYLVILNHHQVHVADELYSILGDDFRFVQLSNINELKGGVEDYSNRPYLIRPYNSGSHRDTALSLLESSDICVFGGVDSLPYLRTRLDYGKIAFDISERWLKRGWWNIFSPRLLRMLASYYMYFRNKPIFKLCASAYASKDYKSLGICLNRYYKWGYFTKEDNRAEFIAAKYNVSSLPIKIMWCGRLINWKHPELPILLAKRLVDKGYKISIDIFGDGEMLTECEKLSCNLNLNDVVKFKGSRPNEQILDQMRHHDIFLFTSDRNEGWGAVLNEAMSSGMAVVASDQVGAAPYLIEDGINGLMYTSNNLDSLEEKVTTLMDNPDYLKTLAENAYVTMKNKWSPACAARSLIRLSERLLLGLDTDIESGPCSKA